MLGLVALECGDYTRAVALMEEALVIARELGIQWGPGLTGEVHQTLKHLGLARLSAGDICGSMAALEEARALAQDIDDRMNAAWATMYLGHVVLAAGEPARAWAVLQEALAYWIERDSVGCQVVTLADLAESARACGDEHGYAVLAGAMAAHLARYPAPPNPKYCLYEACERVLCAPHTRSGSATFAAAWAEGQAMTVVQAVDYARALRTT